MKKISLKWGSVGFLILGMVGYMGYVYYGKSSVDTNTIYVGTPVTVTTGDIIDTLSFDGTTAFASTQKLIFGQEGKKVTNVFVKVGDKVRQDQVLATLESSDVDSSFKTAKSNLTLAQLNYDKAFASIDKEYDLLKADNTLQTAENQLLNIEATIVMSNIDEDNNIAKATQTVSDAQEDYDDLYTESISAQSDTTRTKRNTYTEAIDDLRDVANTVQTNLDSLDKIMYYTEKFNNTSDRKALIYIGAKDTLSVSLTRDSFFLVTTDLQKIKADYDTLSIRNIDDVSVKDLETAYLHMTNISKSLMTLGNHARSMFEFSIVSVDVLTQNMLDSYITLGTTVYNSGRSLKDRSVSTMEGVYKLDDTLDLIQAKQTLNNAQIALDKLLLNKKDRNSRNQSQRVLAQLAVSDAKKEIFYIENGYNNTTVQNAYNQLIQAQSNLETVLKKYESYQLIANFEGTVTEMKVQVGDTLTSSSINDTYIYVENPNLIEITLNVEQTDILKLTMGDDLDIVLDVFPDVVFSGVISEISTVPTTSNGVSTYTVKAMFEKPTDKKVLGGMTATVNFTVSQKKNVVVISNSSLTSANGNYYVTMEDGTQQQVEIGASDNTKTEIISGLVPGDVILGMKISNSDLSTAGVSSTTEDSKFPGGGDRGGNTTQGGGRQ